MKEVAVYEDSYDIIMEFSTSPHCSFAKALWNMIENYAYELEKKENNKEED